MCESMARGEYDRNAVSKSVWPLTFFEAEPERSESNMAYSSQAILFNHRDEKCVSAH